MSQQKEGTNTNNVYKYNDLLERKQMRRTQRHRFFVHVFTIIALTTIMYFMIK